MPMMRICIRNERQNAVREVMAQLRTSDPKIAVDWIIGDWLSRQDQATQAQPQTAAAAMSLEIQEW